MKAHYPTSILFTFFHPAVKAYCSVCGNYDYTYNTRCMIHFEQEEVQLPDRKTVHTRFSAEDQFVVNCLSHTSALITKLSHDERLIDPITGVPDIIPVGLYLEGYRCQVGFYSCLHPDVLDMMLPTVHWRMPASMLPPCDLADDVPTFQDVLVREDYTWIDYDIYFNMESYNMSMNETKRGHVIVDSNNPTFEN